MKVVGIKFTAPGGSVWQVPSNGPNWEQLYRAMRKHRASKRGDEHGTWFAITNTGEEMEILE